MSSSYCISSHPPLCQTVTICLEARRLSAAMAGTPFYLLLPGLRLRLRLELHGSLRPLYPLSHALPCHFLSVPTVLCQWPPHSIPRISLGMPMELVNRPKSLPLLTHSHIKAQTQSRKGALLRVPSLPFETFDMNVK